MCIYYLCTAQAGLAEFSDCGVKASRWAECRWANIKEVQSTGRNDSLRSLFAEKSIVAYLRRRRHRGRAEGRWRGQPGARLRFMLLLLLLLLLLL